MKCPGRIAALAVALTLALAPSVDAQDVIVSPVSGVINSGGPGFGLLSHTFDQSGLSAGFTSGVTLFDTFLALNPTHTTTFSGFEWFSNSGTTSASVTYDLGSVMTIGRLALWNEESSGIGTLDLWGSVNGVDFFQLALGLNPTDHFAVDYTADVFSWTAQDLRYVRFDMSDCPQPNVGSFDACAIGEVAFASTNGIVVETPEPATALLLLSGLAGIAFARRRDDVTE